MAGSHKHLIGVSEGVCFRCEKDTLWKGGAFVASVQRRGMVVSLGLPFAVIACHQSQTNRRSASTHSLCYKTENSDRRHEENEIVEL